MGYDTILIIDDNIEFLADAMPFLINEMKLKVTCSFSRAEAEEKIRKDNPGIIILDLGMNGCEKLSALKDLRYDAPIILTISDCDNEDYPELSKELGGTDTRPSRLEFWGATTATTPVGSGREKLKYGPATGLVA